MPTIPKREAADRLARAVERASSDDLTVIFGELYPTKPLPAGGPRAADLAAHIREDLEPEELVDLWNVVFPTHHDVFFDEEEEALRYNDNQLRFAGQ
jgi:hypothetical protein